MPKIRAASSPRAAVRSTEPRRGSGVDGQQQLNLHVLGELTATRDGAVVDLGGRRQRAVLAGLVISRDQVVPADRLVDCVWGDRPPANANGALQAYVSHLRRRLEPDAARPAARRGHRAGRPRLRAAPGTGRRRRVGVRGRGRGGGRAWHPGTRCARWSPRCGCGADRRTPTTPASRGPRRRSPGSPSCAGSPANACSRRASSSARPSSSSATSRRWSRRTRCARSAGGCWRSRSTGPTARPPRSRPCGGHERCSPTSSASTPAPPCVPSRRRSSPSRRTSTGRGPQRPRTHRRRWSHDPAPPTGSSTATARWAS